MYLIDRCKASYLNILNLRTHATKFVHVMVPWQYYGASSFIQ